MWSCFHLLIWSLHQYNFVPWYHRKINSFSMSVKFMKGYIWNTRKKAKRLGASNSWGQVKSENSRSHASRATREQAVADSKQTFSYIPKSFPESEQILQILNSCPLTREEKKKIKKNASISHFMATAPTILLKWTRFQKTGKRN